MTLKDGGKRLSPMAWRVAWLYTIDVVEGILLLLLLLVNPSNKLCNANDGDAVSII